MKNACKIGIFCSGIKVIKISLVYAPMILLIIKGNTLWKKKKFLF